MLVNTEIKDRIAYVEMQNADHFNCLSEEMCEELIAALDEASASECVGVVIKAQVKKGVWSGACDLCLPGGHQRLPGKTSATVQGQSRGFGLKANLPRSLHTKFVSFKLFPRQKGAACSMTGSTLLAFMNYLIGQHESD